MLAIITIRMDSDAFRQASGTELCRILRLLARRIETEAPITAALHDSNGKKVGTFRLDGEEGGEP